MNYYWIGHCREGNSDKIWGLIRLNGDTSRFSDCDFVAFWGRRGKRLQTKIHHIAAYEADRLVDKKESRGYNVINPAKLDEVYPEFEQDLETTAMWSLLKV